MDELNTFSPQLTVGSIIPGSSYLGSRPVMRRNPQTGKLQMQVNRAMGGFPVLRTNRGLVVNSLLYRDEWQRLDTKIQQSALTRLVAVQDLRSRGLTDPVPSLGTLEVQWTQASEMAAASISMYGEAPRRRDRVEHKIAGVPLPIVYMDFDIPTRENESARLAGRQLDTSNATAAARVVSEKLEDMAVNGDALTFNSRAIYGYTSHPHRKTATAGAGGFPGGDWGTLSNIVPTVSGAIGLLATSTNRYFGPYMLYVATTQYTEADTNFFSDGTGDSGITRIKKMTSIQDVKPLDSLADGSMVLVQLVEDVIQWAEHSMVQIVEWMSGDGMVAFFRVLAVGVPKTKSDYGSRSGIAHISGI